MANGSKRMFWCQGVSRLGFAFAFLCFCMVGYLFGPPLFWPLKEKSTHRAFCRSCFCDCSSTDFSLPPGLLNSTYSDCSKKDPYVKEEMGKSFVTLLHEEVDLQRTVSNETLERTRARTKHIKKAASLYRRNAEKCIAGVETCEEARERAEAELREELKLTALWKKRARQLGWKDDKKRVHS